MRAALRYARDHSIAFAALFLALAGTSFAVTSGGFLSSSGQLRVCAKKSTGALRLVKPGTKCGRREAAVIWNSSGPRGASGIPGPQGTPGPQGNPGPTSDVLPSGKTERGWFVEDRVAAANEVLGTAISFDFQLPSAPAVSYVDVAGAATASCPGSASNPQAVPGVLCMYLVSKGNLKTTGPYTKGFGIDDLNSAGTDGTADAFGAEVYGAAAAAGRADFEGTYAVTAP